MTKWFWRSCFTGRYSSQTRKTTIGDIKEVFKLKNGEISELGEFSCNVNEKFFKKNQFSFKNANTKTFILLLANNNPKSLLSGSSVDLDRVLQKYNKTEFHYVYPRAYLKDNGFSENSINCLANLCFLSTSENKKVGRKKPSEYVDLMPDGDSLNEILSSSFCPLDTFNDDFESFLNQRSKLLAIFAKKLIQDSLNIPTIFQLHPH